MSLEEPGSDGAMCPVPRSSVEMAHVGDSFVLFDAERFVTAEINAPAALVWLHVDGVHAVDDIVRAVASETERPADDIRTDVIDAIRSLEQAGFVHGSGPAQAIPERLLPPVPT